MAPSQMEHSLEYTHKKFNCGYSHKKLGMRLIRRDSQEEMQYEHDGSSQDSMDTLIYTQRNSGSPQLFRPYALDEEESCPPHQEDNCSASSLAENEAYIQYAQYCSQQQSPDAYALKLQRQRAALYMKHIMQYYENGNGWPTMHPNALNNHHHNNMMAYQNHSY